MEARPLTVLVVDDEFTIVETLAEILSWEGYRVVTAPNGREGLAALEKDVPDLVLLDMMMPVMDGLQMLEEMRRRPEVRHVPVVLMTAAPMQLPRGEQLYDALLLKPFGLDALTRTLGKVLGRQL
ncbi:response regulator [Vulgatibacter sp.]|uniref:response regulator n=1 Tax=Vulgatibacter sp. TaxID=1971226 RepID=UPI00356AC571